MKKWFLIIVVVYGSMAWAQQRSAVYPGGMPAFYNYINQEFRFENIASFNAPFLKFKVQFVVNEEGKLDHVKVEAPNEMIKKEVTRVLARAPKWVPALHEGKPEKTNFSLPFTIENPHAQKENSNE